MSTNKTTNLQLHQWESSDAVSRGEFNENFQKLDGEAGAIRAALAGEAAALRGEMLARTDLVLGLYHGNGGAQEIVLGFRPRMVIIPAGNYFNVVWFDGAGEHPLVAMTDRGFRVTYVTGYGNATNSPNSTYPYFALK